MIDLRSDTVTRPSQDMRKAMANAEVDDDVIDVDPTVDRLQQMTAELLGKEAAIYMPSGTMTNQVAVRLHCSPGDELLCEEGCHIFHYEQGAFAQLSGIVARTLQGEYGVLRPEQFAGQVRPENEHLVRTRLVCLENTHNRGAGRVQPLDYVAEICQWAPTTTCGLTWMVPDYSTPSPRRVFLLNNGLRILTPSVSASAKDWARPSAQHSPDRET